MRPIDSTEAIYFVSEVAVSFDFSPTRVTLEELDEFVKFGWFSHELARLPNGETILDPHDDEVVIYREFFMAGLRFSPHPLVIGVLKRFNLKFHQLNPSSFMKLSVYV